MLSLLARSPAFPAADAVSGGSLADTLPPVDISGRKKTRIGPRADFFTAGFSLVSPGVLLTKITNSSFVKWPELKTEHISTWKEWKREFWMAQHSVACSSPCILGLPTGAAGIYTPSKPAPGPFLFAQTSVDASWHQGDAAVVQEHPVKLAVPRYL